MRRREFITIVVGVALAWPLLARAQQSAMPVVGFINAASAESYKRQLAAFLRGLREMGFVDGRNVAIEYRWADGRNDRLPALAADLVQRQVTVIAATSTPAVRAAKEATKTIPIVFELGDNPVRLGFVASFNQPGANVTGITQMNVEIAPKRLQLLHELIPAAHVIALLVNPADPAVAETTTREMLEAARTLGLELHVMNVSTESEVDAAFAKVVQIRAGGLVIGAGPFFVGHTEQLAALAVRHAVPTIYEFRQFTAAGGLMSYGTEITEAYHLTGIYTGRVLKGEKPADLPVQQATKVELMINLKTAKALGITVPNTLIGRADEVFE